MEYEGYDCCGLYEDVYFRWHQIILRFGLQSIVLTFDNQLDRQIELPSSFIRKTNITHAAFLRMGDDQASQTKSFFQVKSYGDSFRCNIL